MNCTQAKTEIALLVGGDLEESSESLVRQHLSRCSDCRDRLSRMESVMQVMERAEAVPAPVREHESVWPSVSKVLKQRAKLARARRFNGWAAGLAVAATVLAMVTVFQTLPSSEPRNLFPGDEFAEFSMAPQDGRPVVRVGVAPPVATGPVVYDGLGSTMFIPTNTRHLIVRMPYQAPLDEVRLLQTSDGRYFAQLRGQNPQPLSVPVSMAPKDVARLLPQLLR